MTHLKFYILTFFLVGSVLTADEAVIVEVSEFANFREISHSHAPLVIQSLKNRFGSRYTIEFLNDKMDGTPLFPVAKNIKKRLQKKAAKRFIYISSHINADKDHCYIAAADSIKGKSHSFISNTDFSTSPTMVLIQTSEKVNDKTIAAFKGSFTSMNGIAVLINKESDIQFYLDLYEKPFSAWQKPLLLKVKEGAVAGGQAIAISDQLLKSLLEKCEQAKNKAEEAKAALHAPTVFSAASMKMQLLKRNPPQQKIQRYFSWEEAISSFYKSRSLSLQKQYKQAKQKLNYETLKDYGHPRWEEMVKLMLESDREFASGQFESSSNKRESAEKLLYSIYDDITANLINLIKQSKEENKTEATVGLVKSLLLLKPEFKLHYAYQGQTFTNKHGIKFVFVPAGKFTMGSPSTENGREHDENLREITISRGFYMSVTEITEKQWTQVMGLNYLSDQRISQGESFSLGADYPQRVSWREASKFCQMLSQKEKMTFRLPTEAEWEYACKAGSQAAYSYGNTLNSKQAVTKESRGKNQPEKCGLTTPNKWGLYDMHGNLWEWCSDWSYLYENSSLKDPRGPTEEFAEEEEIDMKVVRGGSYDDPALKARSSNRWEYSPSVTSKIIGFRIVLELQDKDKK